MSTTDSPEHVPQAEPNPYRERAIYLRGLFYTDAMTLLVAAGCAEQGLEQHLGPATLIGVVAAAATYGFGVRTVQNYAHLAYAELENIAYKPDDGQSVPPAS